MPIDDGGGPGGQFTDPTGGGGDQPGGWWDSFVGWLTGGNQNRDGGGGGGGGGIPVSTGGKTAASAFGGTTGLDWAKFLANLYASQKKGKFQNVPLSPEQQALFGFTFNRLAGSPDNSKNLYPLALSRAYQTPTFDINAAMNGRPAYSPGQTVDYQSLMKMIGDWNPTTPTPTTTTGEGNAGLDRPATDRGGRRGGIAK